MLLFFNICARIKVIYTPSLKYYCVSIYIYLYQWLYTFICFHVVSDLFVSIWRTVFSISYKTGLVIINSLCFHLPEKVCLIHFDGQFCEIDYFWLAVFSFSTLNVSSHCLLACVFADNKSAVNLSGIPLCVVSPHPTPLLLSRFSFCLSLFYCVVSGNGFLCVYSSCSLLIILNV